MIARHLLAVLGPDVAGVEVHHQRTPARLLAGERVLTLFARLTHPERPHRLDRHGRHRLQQRRGVRAPARAAEELAHLVRVAAGDRQTDQVVVVVLDPRTVRVRVRLEHGLGADDLERRHGDRHVDDHVVHRERLGIGGHVQARRLLVADSAAQQQRLGVLAVRPHDVGPLVDQLVGRVDPVGVWRDVVEDLGAGFECHAGDLVRRRPVTTPRSTCSTTARRT
jgi:hypothetical protein